MSILQFFDKRVIYIERDWVSLVLLLVIALILAISWIELYSVGGGSMNPWLIKQVTVSIVGIIAMMILSVISIRAVYDLSYYAYFLCLALVLLVDILGHMAMGAQRWLVMGFVNLQPAEFMKIALIIALARYFHALHSFKVSKFSALIFPLILIIVPAFLVFKEPNLGSASIIILLGCFILFLAGVKFAYFIGAGSMVLLTAPIFWIYFLHPYQKQRIQTFLHPEEDLLGAGYNVMQSKIAIGSGGLSGCGLFNGTQGKLNFLPERHTDFLFAVLSEELGFYGVVVMFILYTALLACCYIIALRNNSQYGRIIAVGVASMFFLQIAVNLGMISGLLPVVGITLPLFSYGGSSVTSALLSLGLVLSVHANAELAIPR